MKLYPHSFTLLCVCVCACCPHRATLVTEFTMTQEALALVNASISLPVIQILQLLDVVLALRLSLLHVDVRKYTLDDGDLYTQVLRFSIGIYNNGRPVQKNLVTHRFLQTLGVRVVGWRVLQDLFEKQRIFNQTGARDV